MVDLVTTRPTGHHASTRPAQHGQAMKVIAPHR